MRSWFILLCLLLSRTGFAQTYTDTIYVHFLYGSKPARGFEDSEAKLFGGIKGGHVNIEMNGKILDFLPGNNPLLPQNRKPSGGFRLNSSISWDTSANKWSTIHIPITKGQQQQLQEIFNSYPQHTPYDYAIFGMRCAAASYDVLSEIGLVKPVSDKWNVTMNFYPKLMRKRMLKWAEKNNYVIVHHSGRESRKWESDKGVF